MLDLNAMYLILLSLYYYIFEVNSVFIKISYLIPNESKIRQKQNTIAKFFTLLTYFVLQIGLTILYIPSVIVLY